MVHVQRYHSFYSQFIPLLTQRGSGQCNTVLSVCAVTLRVCGVTLSCRCSCTSHTSYLHMPCMALSPDMVGIEESSKVPVTSSSMGACKFECYKCTYMQPRAKPAIVTGECLSLGLYLCVKCMNTRVEIFVLIAIYSI